MDELAHTVECTLGCDPNFKYIFNKHTQKYESRPHQFNCTYFSAVGRAFPQHRDRMYLMARIIQFFTPGIPMIYYVGLLAGENDLQVRPCESGLGLPLSQVISMVKGLLPSDLTALYKAAVLIPVIIFGGSRLFGPKG